MKCGYSNCFCEDENPVIMHKKKLYHADCLCVMTEIYTIKSLFHDYINEDVVFSQLTRVINNIIFNKGVTAEYLRFGLQYYIDNKITLNYPGGLYYVIQNKDVKKAYDNMKAEKIKKQIQQNPIIDEGSSFTYKRQKKKGFGDILC